MVEGVDNPPHVSYPTHEACEEVAQNISEQYEWVHWVKTAENTLTAEQPIFGPTVFCREGPEYLLESEN